LDEFCTRHRVRILTVFGSAARDDEQAHDLDAVLERMDNRPDATHGAWS
jgi:predicted nucleotidyltransferase